MAELADALGSGPSGRNSLEGSNPSRGTRKMKKSKRKKLRIIPLGGLGEVGRNMTLFEWEGKILICDIGLRFPEEDMPGIDFVIPNISYLKGKENQVLGAVFTHGHYDHIGAIPYLIDKINVHLPLYASPLTKGIILKRQEEFKNLPKLNIHEVKDGSKIKLGPFTVEFFHQNHNIPDNMGLFIQTPVGNILHTSDFKFDKNPVNDKPTNFEKLKEFGKRGVLLLMSDSTDAEEKGHSLSEKDIFKNLEEIFEKAKGRIFAATFASLINRIQQIITLSEKYGRKVVIDGFTMRNDVEIAKKLGYIKSKKGTIIPIEKSKNIPDRKLTVICTGAQGEGEAVLMRITNKEHKFFRFKKGDSVIFSSSVIPGNERSVQILKDNILRQGAEVFHYKMMDIHAGGHAKEEELRQMIRLTKPKFFLPIHGQYSMFVAHKEIAISEGIKEENILIAENGQVIILTKDKFYIDQNEVVPSNIVFVDGLGIGDVGEVVLRDRMTLSKDGMFVIIIVVDRQTGQVKGSPDIISRGFVYLRESKELLKETRQRVIEIVERAIESGGAVNWIFLKDEIKNKIGSLLYKRTKRRPMVLPVIIEA